MAQKEIYTIEIFTKDFIYKSSMQISDINYEIDYLDVVKSKVKIPLINVEASDYIRIESKNVSISGIVVDTEEKNTYIIITYRDFMSILDVNVLADASQLTTKSMETFIGDLITSNYIANADTSQNILGLSVVKNTSTTGTVLVFKSNIVNFYKDIVYSAFIQYNIVVRFALDFQNKNVVCTIEKNTDSVLIIEADLPNIIEKNIELGIKEESINKLIIINEDLQTEQVAYFLHDDDTISTVDEERIEPVVFNTVFVTVSDSSTFAETALAKAITTLTATKYNNLIELTVINDDELTSAKTMKIGQNVQIYNGNNIYNTVLTGKEVKKTTTLIFGAVRNELTKKLKRRM